MKLFVYPPADFGANKYLPTGSPFCLKSWAQLHLSGQEYDVQYLADPRKAPMQKLPILEDGDRVIADSFFIQKHMASKYGFDLNSGLSAQERAQSHSLVRMFEEHVYFIALSNRWVPDATWIGTKAVFFGDPPPELADKIQGLAPKFMRSFIANIVRKSTIKAAKAQGVGRFTDAQLVEKLAPDLDALKDQLGSQAFLFGDAPTAADTSIVPILDALLCNLRATPLSRLVSKDEILMGYISRGRNAFYVN